MVGTCLIHADSVDLTGADLGKIFNALHMGVALKWAWFSADACALNATCKQILKTSL